jgi:hypothetical protein
MTDKQDQFQEWLAEMDDALERFFASLPQELAAKLDYTPESLDALEAWILQNFAGTDALLDPKRSQQLDGMARYVGETLRKNVGGKWEMRLDDPKYVYYGLPQLSGFAQRSTPESPHSLVTASADRRTGDYISSVVRVMMKRYRK